VRVRVPKQAEDRQDWAEELAGRLDRPLSVLGIVFLLVVLGQAMATGEALTAVLSVAAWLLWLVFAGEYALRLYVAPRRLRFLRRTWWQLIFLAVPFLRVLRVAQAVRAARAGSVVSSAVRGSRSTGQLLSSRIGWLSSVSLIVILGSSQLLHAFSDYPRYADALHDAAMGTITGAALGADGDFARLLEVVLAAYSVVVFAALAAALGAYFLNRGEGDAEAVREPSSPQ
jgi:voltage-gated potassium channel